MSVSDTACAADGTAEGRFASGVSHDRGTDCPVCPVGNAGFLLAGQTGPSVPGVCTFRFEGPYTRQSKKSVKWSFTKSRRDGLNIAQEELLGPDGRRPDSPIGTYETEIIKGTRALCKGFVACVAGGMGSNARTIFMELHERLQTSLRDFRDLETNSQDWRPGLFSWRPYGTSRPASSHSIEPKSYKFQRETGQSVLHICLLGQAGQPVPHGDFRPEIP